MKRSPLPITIAIAASLATPLFAQDEKKDAPAVIEVKPTAEEPLKPVAEEPLKPVAATEPKVIAKVDGVAITEADVEQRFLAMYGSRLASMPPEQAAMMRGHAMPSIKDGLISQAILLNAADKAGIKVDQEKLAEMIKNITKRNEENGVTPEQFYGEMKMDEATFKADMAEQVRIQSLIDKQTESVVLATDAETKKFYDDNAEQFVKKDSVEASHILIKTEGDDEATKAKKKAEIEAIRKQLIEKKGENFAELAKAHSACPSSENGGSLGDFEPGRMVPAFDKAAFSQKVGEIGQIVETNFGYHVIKVTNKTEGRTFSYEEVKDNIAAYLDDPKKEAIALEYIEGLRKAAKIEDLSAPAPAPQPVPAPAPAPALEPTPEPAPAAE